MVWVRVQVGSGWPENMGRVMGQPVFALGQKIRVQVRYFLGQVGLENSDPFCYV